MGERGIARLDGSGEQKPARPAEVGRGLAIRLPFSRLA
jgi:hypothetical protein